MIDWNDAYNFAGSYQSQWSKDFAEMFQRMAEEQLGGATSARRKRSFEEQQARNAAYGRAPTQTEKTEPKRLQAIRDILEICNYASAKGWMARLRQVSACSWACDFENEGRKEFAQGHGDSKEQALARACMELEKRL